MDGVRKKSLRELLPKNEFDAPAQKAPRRKKADQEAQTQYYQVKNGVKGGSLFFWACVLIIMTVGGYYLSTIFSAVTVNVTPKQSKVSLDGQYEAAKAPSLGIEYSVIKLEDSASKTVPATGKAKVDTKATGKVLISNTFSKTAQKLVVNTRLETKEGLIFRLNQPVTIPGYLESNGKIVPGQVGISVTADKAGPTYNLPAADLKIVGYKGTAKYEKIVAKLDGPTSGGASGEVSTVSSSDREKTVQELKEKLTLSLKTSANKQIPKDSVLFDEGMFLSFTDEVSNTKASSSADIVVKGTLVGILFDGAKFNEFFAKKQIAEEDLTGVKLASLEGIKFELVSDKNILQSDKINFKLTGESILVWPIDSVSLKGKLAGVDIKDDNKIFAQFPNIYKAKSVVRPPWLMSFPASPDKIRIIVKSQ